MHSNKMDVGKASVINVHVTWIQDDYTRKTDHPNYHYEKLVLGYVAVLGIRKVARIIHN